MELNISRSKLTEIDAQLPNFHPKPACTTQSLHYQYKPPV